MKKAKRGIGGLGILFFIFLTLKLAELGVVKGWSWWWVTCPLWIIPAIILFIIIVGIVLKFIGKIFGIKKKPNPVKPKSAFAQKLEEIAKARQNPKK